jgi:hypothetical protein
MMVRPYAEFYLGSKHPVDCKRYLEVVSRKSRRWRWNIEDREE